MNACLLFLSLADPIGRGGLTGVTKVVSPTGKRPCMLGRKGLKFGEMIVLFFEAVLACSYYRKIRGFFEHTMSKIIIKIKIIMSLKR